jgi:hypothetical protein
MIGVVATFPIVVTHRLDKRRRIRDGGLPTIPTVTVPLPALSSQLRVPLARVLNSASPDRLVTPVLSYPPLIHDPLHS